MYLVLGTHNISNRSKCRFDDFPRPMAQQHNQSRTQGGNSSKKGSEVCWWAVTQMGKCPTSVTQYFCVGVMKQLHMTSVLIIVEHNAVTIRLTAPSKGAKEDISTSRRGWPSHILERAHAPIFMRGCEFGCTERQATAESS